MFRPRLRDGVTRAVALLSGITIVYCAVATFILLKILDAVMGLRVSQEGEVRGLDINEHGEEGYIFV